MNHSAGLGAHDGFAPRFRLVLHMLGLSKAKAASELAVDKSLVGRWAAGTVCPSEHNLSRITNFVAERIPGFSMLDWERDIDSFTAFLGLDPSLARASVLSTHGGDALPLGCIAQAREETRRRGSAYEGFWRTTRPSLIMGGRVFHDFGMIRCSDNGLLEVSMGGAGLGFSGWAMPLEGNFFAILDGAVGFTPLFFIFKGVTLPKATLLDGIVLLAALDGARTPVALPIIMERLDDLSGNREADDEKCRSMCSQDPFANEGDVAEEIQKHLLRDIGPAAASQGGELFLTVTSLFSRGATSSGHLRG